MAHEGGESAGDDRMDISYIDRLVLEVENNGEEDDNSFELMSESEPAGGEDICEESSDEEFEYDSDEDTSIQIMEKNYTSTPRNPVGSISEEGKALLLWRQDKKASFSDWSIEVTVSKRGREAKTMHNVHRCALAAGPKKSGYFEALFQSEQFKESDNSMSRVTLSEDVAGCFSAFLDYLYSSPTESICFVTKDTWRALHYLADYFLVPKLKEDIGKFLEDYVLDLRHLEDYLSYFAGSDDDMPKSSIAQATQVCAERILSIEEDSSLLTLMPPAMFLSVITLLRSSKDIKSLSSDNQYHLGCLAVKYVQTHQSNLGLNYFDALTRELYFPDETEAAGRLAIDLLEIIKLSDWDMKDHGFLRVCNATLSRYLTDYDCTQTEIDAIVEKIPIGSTSAVLSEVLNVKRSHIDRNKDIENISCQIMSNQFGVPAGTVVRISGVKPTDSIDYIRYLVGRQLNFIPVKRRRGITIFCDGNELSDRRAMFGEGGTCADNIVLQIDYGYLDD